MASFRKHAKGWRAEVQRKGVRRSKVFATRQEAKDWAAHEEYRILNAPKAAAAVSLAEVMLRYAREVSTTKRGARWEDVRLQKLARDRIGRMGIGAVTSTDLADWRDRRLLEVAPGSVRREMNLLSAVFTQARREWRMIDANPIADVRLPPPPPKRSRLPSAGEMERLALSAGDDLTKKTARAFHAFRFAIETAMRAGEIVKLTPDRVFSNRAFLNLDKTKNGQAREVPLSSEALRLLDALPDADPVFGLTSRELDVLWRKLRDRAGVADLTFHDSRHLAITRLSRKLDVLALARMVGHRNISQLMTYYDASAEDLAKRLD